MNRKLMRFPGGMAKAITLSYDDGMEQDEHLIDLLKKYDMKCTFNLVPGYFKKEKVVFPAGEVYRNVTEKKAIELYNDPHIEVANHGYNHKFYTTLSTAEMAEDVVECRKYLESNFKRVVKGMAYPYGWYDDTVVKTYKMCGLWYSRTVNESHSLDLPTEFLKWNPTCHHDDELLMEFAKQIVEMDSKKIEQPRLLYVWGHTYEFETNDNWSVIQGFMDYVSKKEDIWYATNGEIYEYVQAYNRLEISNDGKIINNPSRIPVWVDIDGKIYKIDDTLIIG